MAPLYSVRFFQMPGVWASGFLKEKTNSLHFSWEHLTSKTSNFNCYRYYRPKFLPQLAQQQPVLVTLPKFSLSPLLVINQEIWWC